VDPLARTDYESVIADVFHKCNEAFIHAPHQREARPMYFKTVVGDIADALASVVPCDNRGRDVPVASDKDGESSDDATRTSRPQENDTVYKTPDAAMDVVIDNLTPDLIKRICERHGLKKRMTPAEYMTVAENCKLTKFKGTNATRLLAVRKGLEGNADLLYEISVDHDNATAVIERDGEMMYQIKTLGLSYRRCIHAAIQVLRSHFHENDGVHRRHKKSRHLRAGIITPEQEVSATVARQMDDDDLAQRIENA